MTGFGSIVILPPFSHFCCIVHANRLLEKIRPSEKFSDGLCFIKLLSAS
ncbi:hypothetical protein NEISUBOT_03820 [Neisseria subflava NJ9703]|uniref:Uncharacterized protein n=1 Tax=Neisseria subflava NJ9703 TaxID=546268 RepID=A0A9W5ISG8_NEISU|nr:hypothetical protein NEISUBOT_03820 [Neisseria subflava NJ9703]